MVLMEFTFWFVVQRCYAQESFKLVPKSTAIKLIDFGCAVFDKYNNNYTISTRYYRAPEVILGELLFCSLAKFYLSTCYFWVLDHVHLRFVQDFQILLILFV